ncbi:MAG: GSCFA domain-containing protein [Salinivirgaceae bacterium]|nr:GSCFA domain-containing protein [Salinivirgaceae bacterium]
MEFRTPININTEFKLGYTDKYLMLGSCFTENIGQKLLAAKMNVVVNPTGILFNPESIAEAIDKAIEGMPVCENDVFEHNGLWSNLMFHGRFSSPNKQDALNRMNEGISLAHKQLTEASMLILTFGTAFVYRNKADGRVVANCHKLPASNFERQILNVQEIICKYSELFERLSVLNPKLQIVLTISPVRHLRDGAHANQLSKSTLLLASDQLVQHYGNVHYFPSYEIMMDDLRDYRFYANDMVHPSDMAVDYIWQLLRENCFDQPDLVLMDNIAKINSAIEHRPLNPNTDEFKQFIINQLNAVQQLAAQHTNIDFTHEISHWEKMAQNPGN